MIKKLFLVLLLGIMSVYGSYAAKKDTLAVSPAKVNVKLNGLIAIGVINPAFEVRISKRFTAQLETFAVIAPKNYLGTGYPLTLGTGFLEGRYYIKEAFRGFYVGGHVGYGIYRMNKNIYPIKVGSSLDYEKNKESLQYGQNFMSGITLGYTFAIGKHWGIELSWGLGYQLSLYEDLYPNADNTVRADTDSRGHTNYTDTSMSRLRLNRSAEWMPAYKGGVFVSYKF